LLLGSLLAGGGIFYHYVIYLPEVEQKKEERAAQENRQKEEAAKRAEQERQEREMRAEQEGQQREERAGKEKRNATNREAIRQEGYELCKESARRNYHADWAVACRTDANTKTTNLRYCLADTSVMTNPYMGENYCRKTYGPINPSPDCTLLKVQADSIDQRYREAQQRCLAEARLSF